MKIKGWKRWAVTAVALLLIGGLGGALVAVSGVAPIKASSGHWAITAWLLHFSMHRSVATHSIGIDVPPLDDSDLILKGAGHFELGCRPCHGSPELHHPRVALYMTPHPPYLPNVVSQWDDAELFYIVKHGVKFTGMPAYPAQTRDDEVWALVAFLKAFPQMSVDDYQAWVLGPIPDDQELQTIAELEGGVEIPAAVLRTCARCHGVDGMGRGSGAFPRLAGQSAAYLEASLQAYAEAHRYSGLMEPVSAALEPHQWRQLAEYYAALPRVPKTELSPEAATPAAAAGMADPDAGNSDQAALERGRQIAQDGIPEQRIPACASCHGPKDGPRNPLYPHLAGQHADYLQLQLELFQGRNRGGTRYGHLMHEVADALSSEQMRDVARYYASLSLRTAEAEPE